MHLTSFANGLIKNWEWNSDTKMILKKCVEYRKRLFCEMEMLKIKEKQCEK